MCPARVATVVPVPASHRRAVWSSEPVQDARAVGRERATAVTKPVCPARVTTALPVAVSQMHAVLSEEPVNARVPSGESATAMK